MKEGLAFEIMNITYQILRIRLRIHYILKRVGEPSFVILSLIQEFTAAFEFPIR